MKPIFFLFVWTLFVLQYGTCNAQTKGAQRKSTEKNQEINGSHKLDSLMAISPNFLAILDSIISKYDTSDSAYNAKSMIIHINFFERNSDSYFLAGASNFYRNNDLSEALGYLYYRNFLVFIIADNKSLIDDVLKISTTCKYLKYNLPDNNEESLKIDDDAFPGYLYKKINGNYEIVN